MVNSKIIIEKLLLIIFILFMVYTSCEKRTNNYDDNFVNSNNLIDNNPVENSIVEKYSISNIKSLQEKSMEINALNFYDILKQGEVITMSTEEYDKIFFDIAVREQIKPDSFHISEYLTKETFKILLQEYYDLISVDFITLEIFENYYFITGGNIVETVYESFIEVKRSVFTLIIRITDGAIISLFRQI